jgi:TPR repeat protein
MKGLLLITTALVTFTVVLSAGAPNMPVMAPPTVPMVASATALALPTPATNVAALASAEPTPAATTLDPNSEEVATLIKRGQQLAAAGDVAAARLILMRAADAHNAGAALALGATYDPNVLETLGIHGIVPDIAAARGWYKKAKEYGSAEASRRI